MDAGSEFNNNAFNSHYSDVKIYRKSPEIHNSTGIIERRNRYIRDVLQKYFTSYHTLKWVDIIQKINTNINGTYNRSIKHAPKDVWNRTEKNEQEIREAPTKYEVGDRVRLLIQSKDFEKKSTGRYSNEVYTITAIDGLGYRLDNIDRKVFPFELLKVDTSEEQVNVTTRSSPKNIEQQRTTNKKQNTINRRLAKENLF
jgi:hypothetical protein